MERPDEYIEMIAAYQASQNFQFALLIKLLVANGNLEEGEYETELERYIEIAERSGIGEPRMNALLNDFLDYLLKQNKFRPS